MFLFKSKKKTNKKKSVSMENEQDELRHRQHMQDQHRTQHHGVQIGYSDVMLQLGNRESRKCTVK